MINYNEEFHKISPYDYSLKSFLSTSTNNKPEIEFIDYEKQYKIN